MELGGNAPFIVFDDADLEAAVQGAVAAKMMHGGEACIAANRFYVQDGVYERFAAMLAQRLESVRVGDGCESGTICGAMINQAAIDKINGLVDDAIARGNAGPSRRQAAGWPWLLLSPDRHHRY